MLYNINDNRVQMIAPLYTTWFTEYLKITVEIYCSEKKYLQNINIIDNASGHPRPLMEIHNEINVFMPTNTQPFHNPWIKE